ncbi:MAG: tyrosine-type recombinase/integrase [Sedimentisphaerales bacterium]
MDKIRLSIVRDSRNKDSPWACRWYEPTDPESGKRKRRCRSFLTKQEAKTFAAELRLERPAARVSGDVTLARHCSEWLSAIKPNIRPATYLVYAGTVERLLKHFGRDCPLDTITAQAAERFIAEQHSIKAGREDKLLSAAAKQQHLQNSKAIFNKAIEWGRLTVSPLSKIKRMKVVSKRWHRFTPAEYLALLDTVPDLREKCLYALLFTGGLRLTEALALQWSNIDFERGRVVICNREPADDWPGWQVKDSDQRPIPLPKHTIDLLTKWQGEAVTGNPFVVLSAERAKLIKAKWQRCKNSRGQWLNHQWANNTLRRFIRDTKRAGIKPTGKLTIHVLRKNACQNWVDAGLPMHATAAFMGHSDIQTTRGYYNQVDDYHVQKAATAIQNILDGAEKKTEKVDVCDTYEQAPATEKR